MSSNRTIWIILLILVLGLCLCLCGLLVAGLFTARTSNLGGMWPLGGRVEATEQSNQGLDVPDTIDLTLDVPVGDITIRPGQPGRVEIDATKHAWGGSAESAEERLNQIDIEVSQEGSEVRIVATGLSSTQNIARAPRIDMEIAVPPETALNVTMQVGRLEISEIQGDVEVMANVGEVRLVDVTPAQTLRVQTQVASIDLAGALAEGAEYQLTSDIGRINLRLPQDSTFHIDARSDIGDVRLEFPLAGRSEREGLVSKEVEGDVGASPTTELRLRSRVGEIVVGNRE